MAFSLRLRGMLACLTLLLHQDMLWVVAQTGEDVRLGLCSDDLSSFLPVPFRNMTGLSCRPIWNNFILRFRHDQNNVMSIILSAVYTTGWVGMGFSKDGMMVGSSAIVGWIGKEGKANIKQYYIRGFIPSEVLPDAGELQLTKIPPAVVVNGPMIYLAFQLQLQARLREQPLLFAFGSKNPSRVGRLTEHDDKTTIIFDFSAGTKYYSTRNSYLLRRNHGLLAIMGWGVFLPVGGIVARYFRHKDPMWFYLHICFQFLGFLLGVATVISGKLLYERIHATIEIHRGIGLFVLVLSILQIMAFFLRPDKEAKIRKYWNWYHLWVGRVALFFAAMNIAIGIQAGGALMSWKLGYGFILSFVLCTVIVLEVLLRLRRSQNSLQPAFQMNPIEQR